MASIDGRSYTWTFVLYPESLPPDVDWVSELRMTFAEGVISPLHDSDVTGTGEFKKPHYHVALKFTSKKSYQQILAISSSLGSNVPPQPVASWRGVVRYMLHVDDPDKHQYSLSDLIPLGGIDLDSFFAPSKTQCAQVISDICSYLLEHDCIVYFDELRRIAIGNPEWIYCLDNLPCYGVVRILNSRCNRLKRKEV